MKVLIASDKFKGSLTSLQAGNAIARGVSRILPDAVITVFPVADGGDGFNTVLKSYLNTATITSSTVDPLLRNIKASYEWDAQRKLAVIEVAAASGLVLLTENEKDPLRASTYGTGLLIKDAIKRGAEKILLGLGGSATVDAGCGILAALGFVFKDEHEDILEANGEALGKTATIIAPAQIPAIKFEIACDVENILFGHNGAAYVYGPQKGADAKTVRELDNGLQHIAQVLFGTTHRKVEDIPGTGAAGGIAAALLSFFPVEMKRGIDIILSLTGIEGLLPDTELIITGEGQLDSQSLQGKVVGEMLKLSQQYNKKCIAVCGSSTLTEAELKEIDLKVLALRDGGQPIEELIRNAAYFIEERIAMSYLSDNMSL